MVLTFTCAFLLGTPAYAFPTPEVVWVVGGVLLKPALILFPLMLVVWRKMEWRLKWVHFRAFGNRRLAVLVFALLMGFCIEAIDRLSFYEEPPPVSKSGRPIAEGSELSVNDFDGLVRGEKSELLIIDIRSEQAFRNWHIQGSINMPEASRKEIQAVFSKSLAPQNVIICYGGERSRSIARYLRTLFDNTVIDSVYKGVFQLKLKLSSDTDYIVRNIPPVLANTWLEYGLARHEAGSELRVGRAEESFLSGVAPMDAPPVVVARAGASLRKALGGAWSALLVLFAANAALIFILIYRRKSAWLLANPGLARWLEISIISILTIVVALPAMTFPEFYGTTAQEYPVFGEDNFSRLMVLYIGLLALPLTWHLRHTAPRKERDFLESALHLEQGIVKPWSRKLYINIGPLLAFLVVVYFSVEVNCTGLWSLIFTLWATLIGEKLAEYVLLRKAGSHGVLSGASAKSVQEHPSYALAQSDWQRLKLTQVVCDARQLSATCSGINGLSHSILLERLYPDGSQYKALRSLGQRTPGMGKPGSRLLRVGRELYRAAHPVLEGFRAGSWEVKIQKLFGPVLRQLWLRRASYWLNRHLLPLIQKRLEQANKAKNFREKKRVLNCMVVELEEHFAPFQETMVRLHLDEGESLDRPHTPLSERWTQVLLSGRYVCVPGANQDWSSMDWSELELSLDQKAESSPVADLHARASIMVLCLHDVIGSLTHELDSSWGYGDHLYELSRQEILAHNDKPWPGMKAALKLRFQREQPWETLNAQRVVWPPESLDEQETIDSTQLKPKVLAPASQGGEGKIHCGELETVSQESIVVVEQLLASDLAKLRHAKALYCTRGSGLSHPILVAREWGLPVFKISVTEKQRLLEETVIAFDVDGTWHKASS